MAVFVDMDGVVADLAAGFQLITGWELSPQKEKEIGKKRYWEKVDEHRPNFWLGLPKMSDADLLIEELFDLYVPEDVHVLSAKFNSHEECEAEKRKWIETHYPQFLPENVNIVKRKEKRQFAVNPETGEQNVLIDDLEKNCWEWVEAGGIAVLHTAAENSLICAAKYK